jgi:hypothetical protein
MEFGRFGFLHDGHTLTTLALLTIIAAVIRAYLWDDASAERSRNGIRLLYAMGSCVWWRDEFDFTPCTIFHHVLTFSIHISTVCHLF